MPGATVIVPSLFIVIEPATGVGAVPGVKVIAAGTIGKPLKVSLVRTVGVVAPVAPLMAAGVSFVAKIGAAVTGTVTMAVLQLLTGLIFSQIW